MPYYNNIGGHKIYVLWFRESICFMYYKCNYPTDPNVLFLHLRLYFLIFMFLLYFYFD